MTTAFSVKGNLVRDGFTVKGHTVTIHQRTPGKGDIIIPTSQITHISANKPFLRLPWVSRGSLTLRVGSKKYVLRRIPIDQLEEAVDAVQDAMA